MPPSSYTPIQKQSFSKTVPHLVALSFIIGSIAFLTERFSNSPLFRVQDIEITGTETVSPDAIRHLSNIRYNQHIFTVDSQKVSQQIAEHPWVASAKINYVFPNQFRIDIVEQKPVALLALHELWYVNQTGDIFRQADRSNLDFPIITGIPQEWTTTHPNILLRVIHDAIEIKNACDVPFLGGIRNISEINFHTKTGFRVILRNGVVLSLGFYEPASRIDRLRKMQSKGLDLSVPQEIILDADTVAITKPLSKLHLNN